MAARQSDAETLRALRDRAQTLELARDPLFAGAVAQLVGIIDGLIRVSVPPTAPVRKGLRPSRNAKLTRRNRA